MLYTLSALVVAGFGSFFIIKKINDNVDNEIKPHIDRKKNYLDSLDDRQRELYDSSERDQTPMREIILGLEKRIYELEQSIKK